MLWDSLSVFNQSVPLSDMTLASVFRGRGHSCLTVLIRRERCVTRDRKAQHVQCIGIDYIGHCWWKRRYSVGIQVSKFKVQQMILKRRLENVGSKILINAIRFPRSSRDPLTCRFHTHSRCISIYRKKRWPESVQVYMAISAWSFRSSSSSSSSSACTGALPLTR